MYEPMCIPRKARMLDILLHFSSFCLEARDVAHPEAHHFAARLVASKPQLSSSFCPLSSVLAL